MSKKILIVSSEFPPQPGGIGSHAYHLAKYFHQAGYEVKVITDQRSKSGKEEKFFDESQNFEVIRIKNFKFRPLMYFIRILKTRIHLKSSHHVIATGKFSLWNVALSSIFRSVDRIAIVHGSEVNFKSKLLKFSINTALAKFRVIIAVSSYTKSLLSQKFRNIIVIPNGIDIKEWQSFNLDNRDKLDIPVLITVGRLSKRKGQKTVIRHLSKLKKIYPEICYHCVGIINNRDSYNQYIKQFNLETNIKIHGALEKSEMKEMLNRSNIFVMLSAETESGDVEGFGIAILEANALGIPAIGSKFSGIEDAIDNGVSGVLINPDSTDDFLAAIQDIMAEKERYNKGALEWAKKHDWSIIINRYLDILK